MTLSPLLLEPLADRSLNISAIEFHLDTEDERSTLALADNDALSSLAAVFPCLITRDCADRLTASAQAQLEKAGCRIVETTAILSTDEIDLAAIPPLVEWISGRWYLAPGGKSTANQSTSRGLGLKLLQLVANDADTREIEALFRQDPILSYHLLRLVNSIGVASNRNITSFSQAILILGRQQLKRWLNLMLFSANRSDHRSAMLLAHVTVRARTMELLAKASGLDRIAQEQAFMAGMFSLLGVLFAMPLDKVLAPLNLSSPLNRALLSRDGDIGKLLLALDAAEEMDTQALLSHLSSIAVTVNDFSALTLEAHQWMLGVISNRQNDDET